MRSLFLVLLLANLLVFTIEFDLVRGVFDSASPPARPSQVNAERLRIVRDTSIRAAPPAPPPSAPAESSPR